MMFKSYISKLCMLAVACSVPLMAMEELEKVPLSQSEWESLKSRVRNFEESAMAELVDVIAESRCPGSLEEQVAMLKIAAGMGNKRAQSRLVDCYRNGTGVRANMNMAQAWDQVRCSY